MTIRKYFWAMGAVLLLAAGLALTFGPTAGATGNEGPPCVQTEDHFQRYSWTGGPIPDDPAPSFPDDNWQPNVAGDPHGIGQAGAYFVSHGASGGGDWFYLELVEGTDCPTGSIDVDKTVDGDPECPDDEPCFVIDIVCADLDFRQVYDGGGDLIEGDSTYHDIPPGTVCVVTETDDGGACAVTYDPANANTTGVVITPEDPDNGRDQRVHVMVTNTFCEEPPPTTVPTTTVPDTTVPTTTVPDTTVPTTTVPPTTIPPPTTEPPPPTTEVPPPTTAVPPPTTVPPPDTVPFCEDEPGQDGCARESLPRTGDDTGRKVVGAFLLIAGGLMALAAKKRLTA